MSEVTVIVSLQGARGATGLQATNAFLYVNANTALAHATNYAADSTAGALAHTLPSLASAPLNSSIVLADVGGVADVHPHTVTPLNGTDPIDGAVQSFILDVPRRQVRFVPKADRSTWMTIIGGS